MPATLPTTLDRSVITVHPYAKRLAAPLKRLGIATVRDLLLHTPVRHEDLRVVTSIRDLRVGQRGVVRGRVVTIQNRRSPRRHMLLTEALVSDSTGSIRCVWFQQPYLAYAFRQGTPVVIAGMMSADTYGFHLQNPIIERDQPTTLHAGRLVPVYALTSGISQKQFRILAHAALPHAAALPDMLPADVRRTEQLVGIAVAVRELHFPSDPDALAAARARFAFEELFTYLQRVRASREELDHAVAPAIPSDEVFLRSVVDRLPFTLTEAQQRAVGEVLSDMAGSSSPSRSPSTAVEGEKKEDGSVRPMQRLLNGDVGSGKTVVAAIAAASVVRAGFQAAYLAPTEVLAAQQAAVFTRWLTPLGIRVALWTRSEQRMDGAATELRVLSKEVQSGSAQVIIGTHAILTSRARFHHLALAIVDEQHRFGVEQRAALRAKGGQMPHLLSMTATPIPRTLNLALLGDLDVSVLDELPMSRTPVRTSVVMPVAVDRLAMTRSIRADIDAGRQVFIVCPKIDAEDGNEVAAVEEALERAQRAFPNVSIGVLHGRMRREEQRMAMGAFGDGTTAVLVATTVIEVGVDQPNATIMVVEDAERFGLAQLHQLRGRVGRGAHAGTCFLTTRSEDAAVIERLHRVAECTDGFRLAELDLEERGPGAIMGTTQSGWPELRYATMDPVLLNRVQRALARSQTHIREAVVPAHLE
ncbi:ATP-dependent DNA helicase RecG [Candidatus Uhrbacteria bacterium]|nr:ATP-dependent DNA helicase RecG [Candidatus Uhrbacteria bacterium]